MNREDFVLEENWYGSYFELGIQWYPGIDAERLEEALRVLWQAPQVSGPWARPQDYPDRPATPALPGREWSYHLHGLLQLSDGNVVGCETYVARLSQHDGGDWLAFAIPTGMLELVYTLNYPPGGGLTVHNNPWIRVVDQTLVDLAEMVYTQVQFDCAVIGEEATATVELGSLTPDQLAWGDFLLSPESFEKWRPEMGYKELKSGLIWIPPVHGKREGS